MSQRCCVTDNYIKMSQMSHLSSDDLLVNSTEVRQERLLVIQEHAEGTVSQVSAVAGLVYWRRTR